jgi:polyhydroxyalkanoate synthesis regulator phasin
MRLARALKEKLHDVRLRDKLIAEGKIKKEEVDKLLKELPDESQNLRHTGDRPQQD